ncbi:membrane-spanning 4-domains subfamily A member 4A-like [Salminus brasiliensis]|uniref:membrane-spanning 4-domains subfamily A member 4A-like n=1 Tax=Salminus brasiliensis TaxID=930266 RepID=UPI003B837363
MATSVVPTENARNGFTIVTHVIPADAGQNDPEYGAISQGPVRKLLSGDPKALGTVQIMIGVMTFMLGILYTSYVGIGMSIFSGITFWGACLYITSGALSVHSSKRANLCVVRSSLIMNVFSAVAAGIAIILLSVDVVLIRTQMYYHNHGWDSHTYAMGLWCGMAGVLLVLSVAEFIISICTSAFVCKATCCNDHMVVSPSILMQSV